MRDVIFTAACKPPGGGANEVSPRLFRHFHMCWVPQLSNASATRIFVEILGGFFAETMPDMKALAEPLVAASVKIYERVQSELLPTPAKSHYTFNLRDLSKVAQGVLMITPKHAGGKEGILKLWCHEEQRVFRDRLISVEDRDWFNLALKDSLLYNMSVTWEVDDFAQILYGDYTDRDDKVYKVRAAAVCVALVVATAVGHLRPTLSPPPRPPL